MRKKCGFCLENQGRFDVKTQDYTADCWPCVEMQKNLSKIVVDETPIDDDPCEICFKRPKKWLNAAKKALLCRVCDKAIKLEKKQMQQEKEKSLVTPETKICRICELEFQFLAKNEKECSNCKKDKSIRKSNEKWLKRGPEKKKRRDSNAVAYAFFRKKYSAPNNVCRG